MFVSQRSATAMLGYLGLSRQAALRVLRTGAAGDPVRNRGAVLYEESRIHDLVDREQVFESGLPDVCADGLLVARTTNAEQALTAACGPGRLSVTMRVALGQIIDRLGFAPMVVTVSAYVTAGAEMVGVRPASPGATPGHTGRVMLVVREPGEWYDVLAQRWLWNPPGNQWLLWNGPDWAADTGDVPGCRVEVRRV